MINIICQHNGRFNLYLPETKKFQVKSSVTRDQVTAYFHDLDQDEELTELRILEAEKYGCDNQLSVSDIILDNVHELNYSDCIKRFLS